MHSKPNKLERRNRRIAVFLFEYRTGIYYTCILQYAKHSNIVLYNRECKYNLRQCFDLSQNLSRNSIRPNADTQFQYEGAQTIINQLYTFLHAFFVYSISDLCYNAFISLFYFESRILRRRYMHAILGFSSFATIRLKK